MIDDQPPLPPDLPMTQGFKVTELFLPERGRIVVGHFVDQNSGSGI
jgi:hypothetical protein